MKNTIKISDYPIGSQWRRWDLHVHTPASKLGTSFPGVSWEQYINSLDAAAIDSDIAVIGVTDYMSIDGYEKLYAAWTDAAAPRLSSVDLLIPNIEFRVTPPTKGGKALNLHILIDPSDSNHIIEIKRALRNLRVVHPTKFGEQAYGCCREDLINFARVQNPNLEDDEAAYAFGILQFKPSWDVVRDWLRIEGWIRSQCLIGIANGKDGISGLPLDGFAGTRDSLLNQADFIFSGNPNDRSHYLGKKDGTPPEEIRRMYGGLKPCLHGSDAHELPKLFKPDEDRYCWIKADPTFEGLRQILWEPECRISIGAVHPQPSNSNKIITDVNVTNERGWFARNSLKLNNGLVAIIGEKGSGKTAIADLIAFASGVPVDSKSQSSFIVKGRVHLGGVKVELVWGSGTKSYGNLPDNPHEAVTPLVRYLSQDFVERLCSVDHQGCELQEAIEEVVFSHLSEVEREGYSSFQELRTAREFASQSRQDHLRGQIYALHPEIERLWASIKQRPAKIAARDQAIQQIEEMKKQLPSVIQAADNETLNLLEKEQKSLKLVEQEVSSKTRRRRSLEELLRSYGELKAAVSRQINDILESSQLTSYLSQEQSRRLLPTWDPQIENEIITQLKSVGEEIIALQGSEQSYKPDGSTIFDINRRIAILQESLSKDENNRQRLLDLQKQIASQEAMVSRLNREIEEIDGKTKSQLAQRISERNQLYSKYFEALAEDEKGLRDLYDPMKQHLDNIDANMKFELSAGYRVDYQSWLEKSNRFFDGRKPASSQKKDDIEKYVVETLAPAWGSGNLNTIADAITKFEEVVKPSEFMDKCASPSLKFLDILDWVYSTDHISTSYKIKYGGTSLEHLSPGTRGIALLVLYLLMDEDDRRPLIIDQPEGNLDNSSIYLQLVPYIRKAKEKRQIILVTHNPNLVVATDAEQIIVAVAERFPGQAYPRINYISGALEHNECEADTIGTRQAVCTLLEGGDRAFKEREGRYSIN